jgi:hypothetical protein
MATFILPYRAASASARALSEALGCRRMRVDGLTTSDGRSLTIINWGNTRTDLSRFSEANVLNREIRPASNKLAFFQNIEAWNILNTGDGINYPPFTTSNAVAQQWLNDGKSVVCRHVLAGHSGEGIELIMPPSGEDDEVPTVPSAPLYTMYVRKRDEYRVHVVGGTVTDVQRKARNTEVGDDDVNWQIRNHGNGFNFVRGGVNPDASVLEQAKLTVQALGLTFGAVDIVWNNRDSKATVLEVNTACGLEGTTLERYTAAFSAMVLGSTPAQWEPTMDVVAEATPIPVAPSVVPAEPFSVGTRIVRNDGNTWSTGSSVAVVREVRYNEGGDSRLDRIYIVGGSYSSRSNVTLADTSPTPVAPPVENVGGFVVGQRVRVRPRSSVQNRGAGPGYFPHMEGNEEGMVRGLDTNNGWLTVGEWSYLPEWLEDATEVAGFTAPTQPTPLTRVEVGQRVRVLPRSQHGPHQGHAGWVNPTADMIGQEFTVIELCGEAARHEGWGYDPSWLELVEEDHSYTPVATPVASPELSVPPIPVTPAVAPAARSLSTYERVQAEVDRIVEEAEGGFSNYTVRIPRIVEGATRRHGRAFTLSATNITMINEQESVTVSVQINRAETREVTV